MDSVIFQAMAIELGRKLAKSRLDRVIQVSAGTLVLKFWTGREKVQLLLKADGRGCFHQTRLTHTAPATPPRFCQLLRARLRHLHEVRAEPMDRIVHFVFSGPDNTRYNLILEAFGAQGNLILTDASGCIVDLLWRHQGSRPLLPGNAYLLPEQKSRLSLFGAKENLVDVFSTATDQNAIARLDIAPMSLALARAIYMERTIGRPIEAILTQLQETFTAGEFEPLRVAWDTQSGFLPLALGEHGFSTVTRCKDLSSMIEMDQAEEEHATAKDLPARFEKLIVNQRKKLRKRIARILSESDRASQPEKLRIMGELLLVNLNQIKRGAESIEVDNYYQSPVVKLNIPLITKLSAQENAERYFNLYRKAKRARGHHHRRLQETEQELAWLAQVELALEEAENGDDIYQIQLELENAGMLKDTQGTLGRRQIVQTADQLHRAVSPCGLQIFWGKNSHTNDYVSRYLTTEHDLWFHAHNMPGCHLVLKCGGQQRIASDEDILYAASFAAGYSQGKGAGKVEVIVAHGRDVKKPKGAKPGLVTVDTFRTVMVVPRRL
jgi:predicted ribosome quality control (RQC) complex YloA/Tae2 family protein